MIAKEDSNTKDIIFGWFSTCFFGLGIPVGIFHLFHRRPQIIINEVGIFDRTTHKDFINWEIIRDAYLINIHGQKFISLKVDDNFKPSRKKGKLYKGAARFSEAFGAQELNISLGQVRIDVTKLTEFINAMSKADKNAKRELIKTLPNVLV
ncbi:STM3941 family protein [Pontibacter rugosus]|uniref:STM3941 family protein n=1 Tax=Pontibacter rugosus TaxID=1745966 RepID=A0ABW3SPA3_9BACT